MKSFGQKKSNYKQVLKSAILAIFQDFFRISKIIFVLGSYEFLAAVLEGKIRKSPSFLLNLVKKTL